MDSYVNNILGNLVEEEDLVSESPTGSSHFDDLYLQVEDYLEDPDEGVWSDIKMDAQRIWDSLDELEGYFSNQKGTESTPEIDQLIEYTEICIKELKAVLHSLNPDDSEGLKGALKGLLKYVPILIECRKLWSEVEALSFYEQCSSCSGLVELESTVCPHCGASFQSGVSLEVNTSQVPAPPSYHQLARVTEECFQGSKNIEDWEGVAQHIFMGIEALLQDENYQKYHGTLEDSRSALAHMGDCIRAKDARETQYFWEKILQNLGHLQNLSQEK